MNRINNINNEIKDLKKQIQDLEENDFRVVEFWIVNVIDQFGEELKKSFHIQTSKTGECCCGAMGGKPEELTLEEESKIWKELSASSYQKKIVDVDWTPVYPAGVSCLSCFPAPNQKTELLLHRIFRSRNRQEREEYFRSRVEKQEVRREALADEESVKKVDEIRKNIDCVGCHSEQGNKSNFGNEQQLTLTSNKELTSSEQSLITTEQEKQQGEKEVSKSNLPQNNSSENKLSEDDNLPNQANQKNNNVDKNVLIAQLKKEIAELKKKLNPNNAEQKLLLSSKEELLAKLESKKDNFSQKNEAQATKPSDNSWKSPVLIGGSIIGGIGLLGIVVVIKKKNKYKK